MCSYIVLPAEIDSTNGMAALWPDDTNSASNEERLIVRIDDGNFSLILCVRVVRSRSELIFTSRLTRIWYAATKCALIARVAKHF